MKSLRHIACGAALAAIAVPATATTVEELVAEMHKMDARHQQELSALKAQISQLKSQNKGKSVAAAPEAAPAPAVTKRLDELEKKVAESDKKSKKRDDAIKTALDEQKDRLQTHGFISAYGVQADKDVSISGLGIGKDIQFRSDTTAGIQFDYKVNEKTDAVVQLISNGYDDYKIKTEWAFLRFKPDDQWMIRAGHLRSPLYMYSESMDVGYTYPWVRPPIEIYLVGLTGYDGADVTYHFNTGDWGHDIQLLTGGASGDQGDLSIRSSGQVGAAVTSNYGPWTLRASYTYVDKLTLDFGGSAYDPVRIYYASLGARYDDGQLLAITEYVNFDTIEKSSPLLGLNEAYLTVGYRIDKFMPYASYARLWSDASAEKQVERFTRDQQRAGLADAVYDQVFQATYISTSGNAAAAAAAASAASAGAGATYDATDTSGTALLNGVNVGAFGSLPGAQVRKEMSSLTLGVRYDIMSNVALKLENAYYYGMRGTAGAMDTGASATGFDTARAKLGDFQQVTSFGVDAVF